MGRARYLIVWVLMLAGLAGWANAAAIDGASASTRPKVALVLSGGGARGFSHVGVIKVLREVGIKVDIVTGTSMGSMVGGGYASGYSVEQMQDIILGVDWSEMFAMRADRDEINWRRREDDFKNLGVKEMGIGQGGLLFPDSVVPAQHLSNFINRITRHVSGIHDLQQLPIPFAAIATDLADGSVVVMQKEATLAEAMRASMSIPGAFSPFPFKGRYLVDGGLSENLPVEQAKAMGADIIIAVNAGTPLSRPEDIHSVGGVVAQMIGILTERNVTQSKALLGPGDILITTDLEGFSSGDFGKAKEIIEAGEKSTRRYIPQLKRLAVSQQAYRAWDEARQQAVKPDQPKTLAGIRVEGLKTVNEQSVIRSIDLKPGEEVTEATVEQAAARVWASDDFSLVPYEFEPGPHGTQTLVFRPQEKPWGYNTLRFGGSLSTDFNQEHTFNVLLAHTMGWLNSWGGEWRNEIQFGKDSYFSTSFYQPLGVASPFFLQPALRFESQSYDWYNGTDYAQARVKNRTLEGSVSLGVELGRAAVLKLGAGFMDARSRLSLGNVEGYNGLNDQAGFGEISLQYDTLDNVNFPTSGFYLDATARRYDGMQGGSEPEVSDYYLNAIWPVQWNKDWVTVLSVEAGSSSIPGRYPLGGLFNLSGAYYGRYAGSDMLAGRAILYKRMRGINLLGMPLYLGMSLEAGRVQEDDAKQYMTDDDLGRWKLAGSAFMAVDSFIGPLYLAFGQTSDHDSAVYFFWGRPYQ